MFGLFKRLRTGNKFGVPKEFLDRVAKPKEFTPDFAELQSRQHNLVFLYGNEMQHGRENASIKPLYGSDVNILTHDPFVMVKHNHGKKIEPVVLDPPSQVIGGQIGRLPRAQIKGELYQLTAEEIAALDTARENGLSFTRVRVRIDIHFHTKVHDLSLGEIRFSEQLRYTKRVHMYIGKFERFAYTSIHWASINLLKTREHNQLYVPRYYYSRKDWD